MSPPQPSRIQCRSCQAWHTIFKNDVATRNQGTLVCPHCQGELVTWSGHFFYTLGVDLPKSSADIDVRTDQ
jgi:hypothetical protein